MNNDLLFKEIEKLPENLKDELFNYIQYLKSKAAKEKYNLALLSESSLQKDWLKPEEDEAWNDL
ncbi:MAG TPA: DUF2281 domain-containing protein [Firmicutes bacterium]|nr:DUF2281 domain-containing protein [Bacillota bacterium]